MIRIVNDAINFVYAVFTSSEKIFDEPYINYLFYLNSLQIIIRALDYSSYWENDQIIYFLLLKYYNHTIRES